MTRYPSNVRKHEFQQSDLEHNGYCFFFLTDTDFIEAADEKNFYSFELEPAFGHLWLRGLLMQTNNFYMFQILTKHCQLIVGTTFYIINTVKAMKGQHYIHSIDFNVPRI